MSEQFFRENVENRAGIIFVHFFFEKSDFVLSFFMRTIHFSVLASNKIKKTWILAKEEKAESDIILLFYFIYNINENLLQDYNINSQFVEYIYMYLSLIHI